MRNRKVIGIGETVLDIIFKDNQPIRSVPGGSTFNSLISLGRAGADCRFISETGADRVGQTIVDFLNDNGVDATLVKQYSGTQSPLSLAFLDAENNADYVFYKDHAHDRIQFDYPEITPDDVVLFGSFYSINPVIRNQVADFLDYARKKGAILYYDVNFRASHKNELECVWKNIMENMQMAHIVRGSDEDFSLIFNVDDAARLYEEKTSSHCSNLIYTRGSKPLQVFGPNGYTGSLEFEPVDAVSTIGAGDNFNAGFIFALLKYGITREMLLKGLSHQQWQHFLHMAADFARNCCESIFNYISPDFAHSIQD